VCWRDMLQHCIHYRTVSDCVFLEIIVILSFLLITWQYFIGMFDRECNSHSSSKRLAASLPSARLCAWANRCAVQYFYIIVFRSRPTFSRLLLHILSLPFAVFANANDSREEFLCCAPSTRLNLPSTASQTFRCNLWVKHYPLQVSLFLLALKFIYTAGVAPGVQELLKCIHLIATTLVCPTII
jgi:hypothetical protein